MGVSSSPSFLLLSSFSIYSDEYITFNQLLLLIKEKHHYKLSFCIVSYYVEISEPIYAEDCNCPVKDISTWTEMIGCPQSFSQINKDLSNFEEVDMNIVLKIAIERYHQPKARSFCNYVVFKNQVSTLIYRSIIVYIIY